MERLRQERKHALSRWNHPADELVSPQEFILQLETHGLINDFFVWQLSDMLPLAKKWADAGIISPSRRLSFNLSALQLHVSDLSVQLLKNFDDYGLDITCFGLEVTETAFMDDPIGAGNNLKRLRDAGFKIALDDFGTGFSSLSLLRNMPLDIIKIDKEFIIDVLTNSVDATIVQSIIMLGSKLELEVVAEGVENELVTKWLVDNGCPVQQGFYLFEPMSPKELEDCLYQTMNQSA